MKKKMIEFFTIVYLLFTVFVNISCGGGVFTMSKSFLIELHDENDNIINKKELLEAFEVSLQIDNHRGRKFDGEIYLTPTKYNDSGENGYIYCLHFYLGIGHFESTAERYERRFKKQMEKTGIKVEDKNGKYKVHEIYPLSKYGSNIVLKLEKK